LISILISIFTSITTKTEIKLKDSSNLSKGSGYVFDSTKFEIIKLKGLNNLKINEIKQFYSSDNCKREDSQICFSKFIFKNGLLKTEISFDELKSDLQEANNLAYRYYYKKGINNSYILSYRNGDAYNGPSQQEHLVTYIYSNNILQNEIYREGILTSGYDNDTVTTYKCTTNYFYDSANRLIRKIINKDQDNFATYYIYNGDKLIGLYPAKKYDEIDNKEDSIYLNTKILEIEKTGFENFSKKYFTNKILYSKVIEDNYEHVKNEQLLVNGKPIKTFLESIGKKDANHIIFEIADNYFLFYKIID